MRLKKWFKNDQNIRFLVQLGFLILILWIGFEFYGFVKYFQTNGQTPYFNRPPGVEGFLPISSLMGIKYLLLTGNFNMIHPAGMVLLTIFLLFALFLKNGFCGWICPIGFLSEYLWKFGKRIFGRNFVLPKWADYPLRSLKYLILLFFLWIIVTMSVNDLNNFLNSPYNKMAGIKMLYFFIHISGLSLGIIIFLALVSTLIKNFWCRYLCPYGALLGFLSIFSPLKVTRNPKTCTNCQHCTDACPSNIFVHSKLRVRSDECMACGACISACPEKDTLKFRFSKNSKRQISIKTYAIILVGVFLLLIGIAMLSGHWKSTTKSEFYKEWVPKINSLN